LNIKLIGFFCILLLGNISSAKMMNNSIYNISAGTISNVLYVDKSKQKLFVVNSNAPGEIKIIDEFRITTGKNKGNKIKEGDLKTPEGIYTIIKKLPGEQLLKKYGPLALVLNYPNYIDRINQRSGSNIWIHGRDEEIIDRQTQGCISLENSHILDLLPYVTINETKVVIVDSAFINQKDEYRNKLKLKKQYIDSWSNLWESGNIDDYLDFYSPKFKSENGNSFHSFQQHKRNLEKLYTWKEISIDSIYYITSKKESIVEFIQTYTSPKFISTGKKTLTLLLDENGNWKIVREQFKRIGPRIYFKDLLSKFLDSWRISWEAKNVDKYISYYHKSFKSNHLTYDGWYEDKKLKFTQCKNIRVKIYPITINSYKRDIWEVKFKQKYSADSYSDFGVKTLLIKRDRNSFKIINEMWRP